MTVHVDSSAICLVQVSKFSVSFVSERGEETTHTHQEDSYYRITTGHSISGLNIWCLLTPLLQIHTHTHTHTHTHNLFVLVLDFTVCTSSTVSVHLIASVFFFQKVFEISRCWISRRKNTCLVWGSKYLSVRQGWLPIIRGKGGVSNKKNWNCQINNRTVSHWKSVDYINIFSSSSFLAKWISNMFTSLPFCTSSGGQAYNQLVKIARNIIGREDWQIKTWIICLWIILINPKSKLLT